MVNQLPYILDMEYLYANNMQLEDWMNANEVLIDCLILEACEKLQSTPIVESVTMIELHYECEILFALDVDRGGMQEALGIAREKWAAREDYSKAIRARNLLDKLHRGE